jgi:hypothetical protein
MNGATYFLTFRIRSGELSMSERVKVLHHIKAGQDRFYELFGAVVMPDHAHAILTPNPGFD